MEGTPDKPTGLELTLILTLPTASGTGSRLIPAAEFGDEDLLRSRCRSGWDGALGDFLARRGPAWEELVRQPAEV